MKHVLRILILIPFLTFLFLMPSCKKESCSCPEDNLPKHINDSLWAYYPIKGSTFDSSGHNHTLLLKEGASLSYDQWGFENGAINFDGINNYGLIADGSKFPSSDFTISFYVMARENKGLYFGKQDFNTAQAASFNVGVDTRLVGDVARFSITSNQDNICSEVPSGGILCQNNKAFVPNAWYHLVATYTNSTMKFYVNGELTATKSTPFKSINSCPNGQFVLGAWWLKDIDGLNGKLDEIRIYTRALNDNEVKYLFSKR